MNSKPEIMDRTGPVYQTRTLNHVPKTTAYLKELSNHLDPFQSLLRKSTSPLQELDEYMLSAFVE